MPGVNPIQAITLERGPFNLKWNLVYFFSYCYLIQNLLSEFIVREMK